MEYPRRPKFFANKVVRAMLKSCAAQTIGHGAVVLVTFIAHTEDAGGYRKPVVWFNGHLMDITGFSSKSHFERCRDRAVNEGWLHYEPGRKGVGGLYWADIPECLRDLDNAPTDESSGPLSSLIEGGNDTDFLPNRGMNEGSIGGAKGENEGSICVPTKEVLNTPIPIPIPFPSSSPETGGGELGKPPETPGTAPAKAGKPLSTSRAKKPTQPRPRNEIFDAIVEVTCADPATCGGNIGRVAALLNQADPPYSPAEIRAWGVKIRELWGMQPTVNMVQNHIGKIRSKDPMAFGKGSGNGRNDDRRFTKASGNQPSLRYDPARDDRPDDYGDTEATP